MRLYLSSGPFRIGNCADRLTRLVRGAGRTSARRSREATESTTEESFDATTVSVLVALAGCSGSGKSWATHRLQALGLDAFFHDEVAAVRDRRGRVDWEDIGSFRLNEAVLACVALMAGEAVDIPVYSYAEDRQVGVDTRRTTGAHLVIEGTFAFEVADEIAMRGEPVTRVLLSCGRWRQAASRVRRDVNEGRLKLLPALGSSFRLLGRDAAYLVPRQSKADFVVGRSDAETAIRRLLT